ncbi:MAG TPA: ABC transporter permease [Trebonia sp.]|nr:ABC transporter permease [Trebonia sp.]
MSETVERGTQVPSPPPGAAGPGRGAGSLLRRGGAAFLRQREASVLVIVIALLIYFKADSTSGPILFTKQNLVNLSQSTAPYAIIAIGEVFLLVTGEIDLSVGYTWTLAPFLVQYFNQYYGVPAFLAIVLALLCGALIGWVNGFITLRFKVPSFITTLGTAFAIYGFTLTTSNAQARAVPTTAVGLGHWFGQFAWSEIIWCIALVVIFHVVLTRTRWGLHTVAVGGNLLGASESGINVARIKIGNFVLTGVLGALAGVLEGFKNSTIDPSAGGFTVMFYAVAAAVIGGTAMAGGSGTVAGAFLGMLVLAILQTGFNLLGISANPYQIILGVAIVVAMIANVYLTRLRRAGQA